MDSIGFGIDEREMGCNFVGTSLVIKADFLLDGLGMPENGGFPSVLTTFRDCLDEDGELESAEEEEEVEDVWKVDDFLEECVPASEDFDRLDAVRGGLPADEEG